MAERADSQIYKSLRHCDVFLYQYIIADGMDQIGMGLLAIWWEAVGRGAGKYMLMYPLSIP